MRTLLRLAAAATLIVSCADQPITGPELITCAPTQQQQLWIDPPSVPLVFGTVVEVFGYVSDDCGNQVQIPPGGATVTIRDTAIAEVEGAPQTSDVYARLTPRSTGRTFLIVEAAGHVDSISVQVPDTVEISSVSRVAAGGDSSCAIVDAGEVMCWGYGEFVLGRPEIDDAIGRCWWTPCSPMPVPRLAGAEAVFVGNTHACALDGAGSASCWGTNWNGEVGIGGQGLEYDPVSVSTSESFTALTLSRAHTCGLTTQHDAICWGDNRGGKLGRGDEVPGGPAVVAGDEEWVSLGSADDTTCGATTEGALLCWGILGNESSALPGTDQCTYTYTGKGGTTTSRFPCSTVPLRVRLSGDFGADTTFVEVSGTCARTTLGTVGCWDPETGLVHPIAGGAQYASLEAGPFHACALTGAGAAWCWGETSSGALGSGDRAPHASPVAVEGGLAFTDLAVGKNHSCGVTVDEEVWCWGANHFGQAGVSIQDEPLEPVRVRGQG